MNTKNFLIAVILFFATAIFFIVFQPDNKLHLIACDVGQGDAILIIKGYDQVLIDGGPNDKVLGCLSRNIPFWDKKIEMVVNTHPDADHLKGLISVLKNYQVDQVLANSFVDDTNLFSQFHDLVMTEKIKVYSPREGEKIKIGTLEFAVLWPADKIGDLAMWRSPLSQKSAVLGKTTIKDNINKYSLTLMLKYKNFSAFFPGDITRDQETQIVNWCQTNNCQRNIDILKVSHHGSSTSTSEELLDYFGPKQAIISVGQGNQWGHPRQDVLDRLVGIGSEILRTDLIGDVEITSN
jgi:competence protein ComEC